MKRLLLALFCFPLFLLAQETPKFTVTGVVKGLKEGADVRILTSQGAQVVVAGKAVQGKFSLSGSVTEPSLHILELNGSRVNLFLSNDKIHVTGDMTAIRNFTITGSASHNEFVEFENSFTPLMNSLNESAQKVNSSTTDEQREERMKVYQQNFDGVQKQIDKFIAAKPASFVSPFLLFVTAEMSDDVTLLDKRFSSLDAKIKTSVIGKELAAYIDYHKVGAIGTEAIDFTQPDVEGKPVSLSSFKGKYVLVDFWASWCRPCREENPNVVSNYNKFKSKNFTVLGVSLDRPGRKEDWVKAIEQDGLTWTHVSDLQFWSNAAAQLYHISSIPQNFLVGPDGKIVARNLRGPMLESKLCELLGCN